MTANRSLEKMVAAMGEQRDHADRKGDAARGGQLSAQSEALMDIVQGLVVMVGRGASLSHSRRGV